ncbi:DMT family transporter [Paraflavitalea sp. CAU 1676]|uniref:DMT family transporter n=1 Tax=Paraflavitalea sp. CAU 1676 TaxID=3032598 RepID=UPI0023DA099F|nr:DMT family transporter [Paraflavitalea sp. CAU 1676]MDF2192468.1 DMT family transporter [Paraflavitalea sp. CAU 1676]
MKDVKKNHTITWAGFAITLLGSLLFSTKAIIVKVAFAHVAVDALTLLTLRMVFSLPFYSGAAWAVSRKKDNIPLTKRQWTYVLVLGLFGYYLSSLFDFVGLQYISAGLERLILFLYPTFAVLINTFVFKQPIHRMQKIALLLTYIGIGLAYFGELRIDTHNPNFYFGSFLIFLCAITYSIYIAGSGYVIPKVGATKFTAYAMLAATAGIFIHFLIAGSFSALQQGADLWMYGLLLAIFATVIPSFLISLGMKKIGSNNVAIISSIGPVSTILQAYFILGESIFMEQIAGTVLVIIGVLLIGWKRETAVK